MYRINPAFAAVLDDYIEQECQWLDGCKGGLCKDNEGETYVIAGLSMKANLA
jgi:hypothetical protein